MWYQSAMNYDMMSPNPWNTMNLHMNQLWDHSAAWNNMFSVPQYSFDNFMPYGNMYGNSYLTNPFYSLNQMSWGTPAFNNMPWNNGGNMGNMWSPFGWNGGSFNGNNNGNSNTNSTASRKYNRLLTFMKQLVKYEDGLSASQIDALNDAMRNAKGTTEEKYEKLLDAYNEIDKDTIRDFLAENGHKLGVSSDIKGNAKNKDSFYHRLLHTGFEYETDMDDEVEKFYDEIKTLKGSDGKSEDIEGIIGLINNETYDILDFISSWNNNYKDDSESARVIDHIKKYYDDIDDKEQKADAKKLILKPFVEELIDKANSVKKVLDKDSKEAIEEAISDVREALNNTDESVDGNLSDAFDKLYLYTRQGAMAEFRNDAKAYYGEIDDEVFNDKLFVDEMIKDLESEGFSSSEIEDTEVAISERRAKRASRSKDDDDDDDDNGSSSSSKMKNIDNKPAVQQISALKDEGIITELTTVKKDGTITLYQENKMTGDSDGDGKADYAKLFYINAEGKLVEWKNAKLDADGKLVSGIGETTAKPSEMAKAKKDIEKAEKEEKKTVSDAESIVKTNTNDNSDADGEEPNAWQNGERIADVLIGHTTIKDRKEANKLIMGIKDKDVFVTLAGYEDNDALGDNIITQIVTEGETVPQSHKENWIKHILDCVVKNLTAQLNVEEKKESKNTGAIEELKTDIKSINEYLKNLSENINDKSKASAIDKILESYITETHGSYEDQIWIGEWCEGVGNFFNNLFDWG